MIVSVHASRPCPAASTAGTQTHNQNVREVLWKLSGLFKKKKKETHTRAHTQRRQSAAGDVVTQETIAELGSDIAYVEYLWHVREVELVLLLVVLLQLGSVVVLTLFCNVRTHMSLLFSLRTHAHTLSG